MEWTPEQQKVIHIRNKNVLVSAAAGSGKTAVLVERVISMITEGEAPIDIDRLLVVTFTNAAAAQMREKIGEAIEKRLITQPDSKHLQKQITLLPSAQITTIHSFCLNVIRNYFNMIDLDPSFKMAEEAEITLMKSDVISDILERYYEEGREDFHEFIESYSYAKSDFAVEELILQLYHFSMSYPWPKTWLFEKQKAFDVETIEALNESEWMQELTRYVKVVVSDMQQKNTAAIHICEEGDGPAAYLTAILSDSELLDKFTGATSYEQYAELLPGISFARLSSKREEGVLPEKKDQVKALRDDIKKALKDLESQFFYQSPQEMLQDMQSVSPVMRVLFELTIEFMEAFTKKKEEKNLIDFNDLEHFALKILVEEREGEVLPTLAARELSEHFVEILIDEYQDSNLVQETILQSVSRERLDLPNRFMVGDVKQSIYKFRLAMPELFMEKYDNYSTLDKTEKGEPNYFQRIDLDKNFRSRAVVINCVNAIFEQIMMKSIGGIEYNEEASLKVGAIFEEEYKDIKEVAIDEVEEDEVEIDEVEVEIDEVVIDEVVIDEVAIDEVEEEINKEIKEKLKQEKWNEINKRIASNAELLLVTEEEASEDGTKANANEIENSLKEVLNTSGSDNDSEEAIYTKRELEARAVANRIKELVNLDTGMVVLDDKTKTYRPAAYRDIVILLRSMSNWSEVFVNTLMQEGIPAYADTSSGYFQTVEIKTILSMLQIIDNPRQDIPLAAVLHSPIVGLTANELAIVRTAYRNESMYTAILSYAKEGSEEELQIKLCQFVKQLEAFRKMVCHSPIHELLLAVLDQTGYFYYALAMPAGDRRKANIDLLISHAVRFEKGSYSGLFHFIRYIEKLHKYDVDFGEAVTVGEQDNTIRIMSIHKSKGLQFPIVFVAGMGKQFNTQDLKSKIVLHSEFGVGPEYIDSKLRTKVPTLLKKVIQKKVQIENLGEELRILYVAMTRAKEKLIMTGYLKAGRELTQKVFSFYQLMSANSYLDWVLPAMINRMDDISNHMIKDGMVITIRNQADFTGEELIKQIFVEHDKEEFLSTKDDEIYDPSAREEIKTRFNFIYPYQKDAGLKGKMSVSELKKIGQLIDEDQSEVLFGRPAQRELMSNHNDEVEDATIPNFIRQKEIVSGTDRGTLYHKVLELIDLAKTHNKEELIAQLHDMVRRGQIKESDIELLNLDYINGFLQSEVAARMCRAKAMGKLYKEKQFVIGIKASEVKKELDSEELILIQGIIDVFFEEDGELVLLDYKSDIVKDQGEELLIKRYQVQLDYYQRALEQMMKKKVKEKIIYSLHLGKEIRIK